MMPGVKDMPAEDFLKVIDSLIPHVNPNETFIIITGGEALLRTDLESVGLELYRKGFPWGIVSNGYLLDKTRLESLIASGMHSITISIDGLEESHNWMRRTPQAFEKAMEAVRLLSAEREILWDVVTCVNQKN
jgi:MoaA/NifB/PqqE/SkfB family radical SAM enzyme